METILFMLFATAALFSGVQVILSSNPVHCVLQLVSAFINAAGLFLLMEMEQMALLFLVVQVGAIAVLFLFVVMMLNIKHTKGQKSDLKATLPATLCLGALFLGEVYSAISQDMFSMVQKPLTADFVISQVDHFDAGKTTNLDLFGHILQTHSVYYFLIAGLILLVALIGAIVLTLQGGKESKRQKVQQQMSRSHDQAIQSAANK